ncbi:ribonuclease R [Flavisolibacter tropicus]|uniref:Ribonuclease R n=1 Tax=Flavisolibacter tropicus TaxID=1492898 RepID=A0A172TQH7_9BACT|nr:ribonuclease R [Flavisolibacter tropicus]ANE49325.1 ribonuclease R [Flavisolibacter tropicus]
MGRKNNKNTKKGKRKGSQKETYKGRLEITRSGMGFVIVEGLESDVLVRPPDFNTALNGDTVRIHVKPNRDGKRMQGEVVEVLERKQLEFIGKLEMNKGFAFFVGDSKNRMPDIYIPEKNFNNANENDRVVVRITEWEQGTGKRPVGEVVTVLAAEDANDMAMKEILLENGFPLEFPEEAMEEAARISDVIPEAEINKRRDFRNTLTFTIDPVDAKDFDDALSIRVLKNGNYEIGVHIADVGHYVEEGTALDEAAYTKATSVYLPDRVNPMLPEHISNVLCSLRPHEDKLTFSAVFEMTPKGAVKKYWLGKTAIHSDHRFTYEEVQEIIEKQEGHLLDEILLLNNIAQRLRKKRFDSGAINFSSQEVRFKLDETGKPIGVVVKESKESHQLIEEFMLLANRYVAQHVSEIEINKKPLPFPYRVHDLPSEEKLLPFMAFARKFGHKFDMSSPEKIAESFNQMLEDAQGKPEQHVLEQLGIRTMAKAVYTTENIGHYGLGFENYCHFTSPIRRYPDILVHRVLLGVLRDNIKPDKKMEQKCKHSSERERAAMEAERAANKYKQVEYMQNFLGEEFEGVVSGVSAFGFWVETVEHKCEGMVSITTLSDYDDFRLVDTEYALVGMRSRRKFRMGDKVRIKVVAANLEKRQLDYEWVLSTTAESFENNNVVEEAPKKAKRKKKKSTED